MTAGSAVARQKVPQHINEHGVIRDLAPFQILESRSGPHLAELLDGCGKRFKQIKVSLLFLRAMGLKRIADASTGSTSCKSVVMRLGFPLAI